MFDDGRKKAFLESDENKAYYNLIAVFDSTSEVEEKYNKDILDMDMEELREAIQSIEYSSKRVAGNIHGGLQKYFEYHNNTIFSTFTLDDFLVLAINAQYRLFTYDEILQIEKTIDNTFVNFWYYNNIINMIFAGFTMKELAHLRKRDVFDDHVKVGEREIRFNDYPELKKTLELAIINKSEYREKSWNVGYSGIYEDSVVKVQTLNTSDVFKSIEANIKRSILPKFRKSIGVSLTYEIIRNSGLYFFVKMQLKRVNFLNIKDTLTLDDDDIIFFLSKRYIKQFGSNMDIERFRFMIKDITQRD